jgi:galactokinase
MDQGCAFGRRPVAMSFDGDRLEVEEIEVGAALHLLIVDLHTRKDTKRILERLNRCFPIAGDSVAVGVQELLGPINQRITSAAVKALQEGNAELLGALMDEAQACFDRYATPACPEELAAPALHRVLAYTPLRHLVWGGKGVGSQGDGSAQFVARSREAQRSAARVIERDLGLSCLTLTIQASTGRVESDR